MSGLTSVSNSATSPSSPGALSAAPSPVAPPGPPALTASLSLRALSSSFSCSSRRLRKASASCSDLIHVKRRKSSVCASRQNHGRWTTRVCVLFMHITIALSAARQQPAHPVSVPILHPRETQTSLVTNYDTEIKASQML